MKTKHTIIALIATLATAIAAPLDKPLTVAVKEVTENTPEIYALWEAYLVADLQAKAAGSELNQARDAGLAANRPVAEKTKLVLANIAAEKEQIVKGIRGAAAAADFGKYVADTHELGRVEAVIKLHTQIGAARAMVINEYANEFKNPDNLTLEQVNARRAELDAEMTAEAAAIQALWAQLQQLDQAAAAQTQEQNAAIVAANPAVAEKESALADANAAKLAAWNAYKTAVATKLIADYPESEEVIRAYAADR
jgi:hypothetical protein